MTRAILFAMLVALAAACTKADEAKTGGGVTTSTAKPQASDVARASDDPPEIAGPTEAEEQEDTKDLRPETVTSALQQMEQEVNAPY